MRKRRLPDPDQPRNPLAHAGFATIDVVLAMALFMLIVLVAVLSTGSFRARAFETAAKADARRLGDALMAQGTSAAGLLPWGETAPGTRARPAPFGLAHAPRANRAAADPDGYESMREDPLAFTRITLYEGNRLVNWQSTNSTTFSFCIQHDPTPSAWAFFHSTKGGLIASGRGTGCPDLTRDDGVEPPAPPAPTSAPGTATAPEPTPRPAPEPTPTAAPTSAPGSGTGGGTGGSGPAPSASSEPSPSATAAATTPAPSTPLTSVVPLPSLPPVPNPTRSWDFPVSAVAIEAMCAGAVATIVSNASVVYGTNGNDVILATVQGQTIHGLGGDDIICGGNGKDALHGGPGSDVMYGGNAKDDLFGGPGRDYMHGDNGRDDLYVGPNHEDVIFASNGKDGFLESAVNLLLP